MCIRDRGQVKGAEADAAQRTDQVQLAGENLAVAAGLASTAAPQTQLQIVPVRRLAPQPSGGLPVADQIPVGAAAVGAQAGQQFNTFEKIRFAFSIASDHQQPFRLEIQAQGVDVAEIKQFQAVEPDGTGAISG